NATPCSSMVRHCANRRAKGAIMDDHCGQEEYIRPVLEAYRKTPGTIGTVRRADRLLAAQLYQRGLSVKVIENALVLAATRRLIRPPDAPRLGTIRSLAYFLRVIEEVLELASARNTSNTFGISSLAPGPQGKFRLSAHMRRAVGADDGRATRTPAAW